MRWLKNLFENVMGTLILVQLLAGAVYILTHPVEFLSALIAIVCGVFGLWLLVGGPTHIFEQLMSDKKDENTNREVMKGCAWTLLGVFLLGIASNIDLDKKPSSYQSSPTYVREDYSRPTREYSAHKQDYHPIELPKSYKPVEVTAPKLESLPPPLKTDLPRYAPPPVDNIPLPDKSLTQVPDPIAILENEDARKEFETKVEIARRQWEAYYEANHDKWEAELEVARKEMEARLEAYRETRSIEPPPIVSEPEPYYYPEPAPDYYSEPYAPKLFGN